MPIFPDEDISTIRKRLLDGMTGYMNASGGPSGCDYSQKDIDHCMAIVDAYLAKFPPGKTLSPDKIRDAVKTAVLELNKLSQKCESLIETGQREDLCQLLLTAANQAGLDSDEDITEEWREW